MSTTFTPKHTWTLVPAQATAPAPITAPCTDAESAGTFETLDGVILEPAPKVKPKVEAGVIYITAQGTKWKAEAPKHWPTLSVWKLVYNAWVMSQDHSVCQLQQWLDTGFITKLK